MPQPEATSRPRLDWWWDGSDRGEMWAWLLGLAAVVVTFSLGALVTAGSSPIRGIALANLQSGLGVVLLPTLIALRRLDRRRRLGDFGVVGDREVRRALHRSLATLGLVDERPPGARPVWPLPPVRPASWYRLLAVCWGGFVVLGAIAFWVTARRLLAAPNPANLAVGFAVIALPVLLAWLVVGLVALRKAVRVAHWLATRAKAGRTARAPGQPLGRRLAAGPRRAAGVTVAGWHGLQVGVAVTARRTADATVAGWHRLQIGLAAGVRWTARATVAGWHRLAVAVAAAARWTAAATVAGWHWLEVSVPPAARRAADATLARWHGIQVGLAAAARWTAAATVAGWHWLQVSVPPAARWAAAATVAGWHWLQASVPPAARRAADAIAAGWHGLAVAVPPAARWTADAIAAGWHRLEVSVRPASRRAADVIAAGWQWLEVSVPPAARRAAAATLAGWHSLQVILAAAARWAAAATLAGWHGLKSGVAARAGGRSGQPLSRRLADDGRRGAGVTLARWHDLESGLAALTTWAPGGEADQQGDHGDGGDRAGNVEHHAEVAAGDGAKQGQAGKDLGG